MPKRAKFNFAPPRKKKKKLDEGKTSCVQSLSNARLILNTELFPTFQSEMFNNLLGLVDFCYIDIIFF